VAVLPVAERMNETSANMLLKTLEEPPAGTVLILTSEAPEGLAETIRSRLQRVRFGRVPPSAIRQALAARPNAAADGLEALIEMADGSLGRAIELADGRLAGIRRRMIEAVEAMGPGSYPAFGQMLAETEIEEGEETDGPDASDAASNEDGQPEGEPKFTKAEGRRRGCLGALDVLGTIYLDVAAAAVGRASPINADFRARIAALADRLGIERAQAAMEKTSFAHYCVRRNCSVDLVCRVLCGQLARIHGVGPS